MESSSPSRAQIYTESGETAEAKVCNLAELGAFLATDADVRLRDVLTVDLLDLRLAAQVLFVCEEPRGVVVAWVAEPEDRAVLVAAQDRVDVLPDQLRSTADLSTADTRGDDGTEDEPFSELSPPKLGTDDLMPMSHEPQESADSGSLDPGLFAAAMMDDGYSSDTSSGVSALDPSEFPEHADTLEPPEDDLEATASGPSTLDVPILDVVEHDEDDEPVTFEAVSALPSPAQDLASDLEAPQSPIDSGPVHVEAEPTYAEGPGDATSAAEDAPSSLPHLDRDGYTVRFDSAEDYREQLAHNLRHGALVVQAAPLPIGTQRMLALLVPGEPSYTVSARVMFSDEGKLGFMLDSFALHKSRLESLGA